MRPLTRVTAAIAGIVLLSALTACASSAPTAHRSTPPPAPLTVVDGWVKAADSGMTSAFAALENHGTAPVTVVAARSSAAESVQLHETVQDPMGSSSMKEAKAGFAVPAHGSLVLAPGGRHIMLMGLTGPVEPGDSVTITLTLDDGRTVPFTATAKAYSGADESYDGGMSATPTPGSDG
ncbi:copper chaperone PCu(A)C [Leifsonia sp. NPDC080035]|uniref:Copper chaperone PCu(A)C n=1 Tax=Leifsonia sp. NPDC080035 TaxID=3143936 RepID=A0AAU7GHR6_9MICO